MEIKLTRIKSIYGDVKGLLSEMPKPDETFVAPFIVKTFNNVLNNLSEISETDYSGYTITEDASAGANGWDMGYGYMNNLARTQIGRLINRLEEEYGFGMSNKGQQSPSIAIFNKNQNEISLQINYTINDLINETEDEEAKTKLKSLKDELEKPRKNWDNIKNILIWILNFSKDAFLQVLPIILQNYKN